MNADITKLAMGLLNRRLRPFNARPINVVHDELVFEVPKDDAEEAAIIIRDEMEAAGRECPTCVLLSLRSMQERHGKSEAFPYIKQKCFIY